MRSSSKARFAFSRQAPLVIGCCFGITLSLLLVPVVEERCPSPTPALRPAETPPPPSADDYEPVPKISPGLKKGSRVDRVQVPRSRYYSTELGIREKLFVGVLSTPKTVLTLGSALNRTISKYASKVLFFLESSETETIDVNIGSVVEFSEKRESILAPFNMLQYVTDNYLGEYDFYFFTKDTTHIRGQSLIDLVSHISISQDVHMGRPLDSDSLYCSLDAGVLLSQNVFFRTVKDLEWCIQHTFSQSDSNNFGRCVLHGTELPCVSAIQGINFVSHQVPKLDSIESSILKSSWPKDLKNAVSVYPVLSQENHYLIHHYFCQQELIDNQHKLLETQERIYNISLYIPSNISKLSWPIGIEPPFKPYNRFDVLPWIYFNTTHNFLENELAVVMPIKGLNKYEIEDLLRCVVQWNRGKYNDRYIFQKLVNGYKRFDPTRGTEYILDMLFLEDATGQEMQKRIFAVRPLNEVEIVPVPFVTEHTRVILLVVIKASEKNEAVRFLEDYTKRCIEKQDSTVMLLVLLYGPQDPGKGEKEDVFREVKDQVNSIVNRYRSNGAKLAWFSVKTVGKMPPYFAIIDLVSRKLSSESLILLCHVGMEIHPEYINRVRMNTIMKTQVFFPIPFRQYHPALAYKHITFPGNVEVKKDLGHFDRDSFEHVSFYLSDYLSARKQLENTISMVKQDKDLKNENLYNLQVDLFDIFLQSKLHVMRAVEPFLRVRYKLDSCDLESNVLTYQECLSSREKNLGTKSQLASAVLSHADLDTKDNLQLNSIF